MLESVKKYAVVNSQRQRKDPRVLDEKLATADLKVDGKVLDDKEKLMIFIGVGSRSSKKNSRRSDVSRGSCEQEVGFDFKIVAFSSALVIG